MRHWPLSPHARVCEWRNKRMAGYQGTPSHPAAPQPAAPDNVAICLHSLSGKMLLTPLWEKSFVADVNMWRHQEICSIALESTYHVLTQQFFLNCVDCTKKKQPVDKTHFFRFHHSAISETQTVWFFCSCLWQITLITPKVFRTDDY